MTTNDFVRVVHGWFLGCTGVVVAAVDGGYDVRMTATGLVRWFGEDELRRDKRTSELRAEARERIQCDGMLPCWDSWLAMRSRMAALEERDALRDARDAERYDVAFVDGQMRVRVREEVAA